MSIKFEAECKSCGRRAGITLPDTMHAKMAVSICKAMTYSQRCKCGGAVEVYIKEV